MCAVESQEAILDSGSWRERAPGQGVPGAISPHSLTQPHQAWGFRFMLPREILNSRREFDTNSRRERLARRRFAL
jgi:hypothetical protein